MQQKKIVITVAPLAHECSVTYIQYIKVFTMLNKTYLSFVWKNRIRLFWIKMFEYHRFQVILNHLLYFFYAYTYQIQKSTRSFNIFTICLK